MPLSQTPIVHDLASVARLREVLVNAGYTAEAIVGSLGESETVQFRVGEMPSLEKGGPLPALLALFHMRQPLTVSAAREALRPLPLEAAETMRIVHRNGDQVRGLIRLVAFNGMVLACDWPGEVAEAVGEVTGASITLAHLTARRPIERALDLGTGCGVQALLLARHAAGVLATDISDRALAFAAFNASLNGTDGVRFSKGRWFEAAKGHLFDLIVAVPPFLQTPESEQLYADTGLPDNADALGVLARSGAYLNEGGIAHVFLNSVHRIRGDWAAEFRPWLSPAGCDVLLLLWSTDDPVSYAARCSPAGALDDLMAFAERLRQWRRYYEARGIEATATAVATLRRRSSTENWIRIMECGGELSGHSGDHVLRLLWAADHWDKLEDERWLMLHPFRPAGELVVKIRSSDSHETLIRCEPGLGLEALISPLLFRVVTMLDGKRPLRDLIAELPAAGRDGVISEVRCLVERGILVPA